MPVISKTLFGLALTTGFCAAAFAQAVMPDPSHLPIVPPDKIKWSGDENSPMQQATLFGDPSKPGPYGVLIKWNPGHFSMPHFHNSERWAYVFSPRSFLHVAVFIEYSAHPWAPFDALWLVHSYYVNG